jgi:ABC-2 type transport system permease protein
MTSQYKRAGKVWWLPLIFILLVINFIAAKFHKRIDLTNEKRFTISSPVKKILSKLDDVVQIDIFLKGEFPSGFKNLATSTEELLQEFKEYNRNNIQYRFISADEIMEGSNRTYADTLIALGAEPINLKVQLKAGEQSQYIFPEALVHYKDKMEAVSLYTPKAVFANPESNRIPNSDLNSAEALLEYKFANAIEQLTQNNRPMIAYSSGNGEPLPPQVQGDNIINGIESFDLFNSVLRKNYNVFTFNINAHAIVPDTFKLLMIVKPSVAFTEQAKLKIDQYVMHGGRIMWCIDRLNAEADSLQIKNQVIAYDRNLNLEDLLFKYGVRVNPDLIMDLQCDFLPFDVNGKGQFEFLHWNYFPLFESGSNHPINKNTGLVAGKFVNSIDTVRSANISKTILLSSSPNSRTITAPALISGEENRNAPEDARFRMKDIAAGVLLEGKFTSLYANRIPVAVMDSMDKYGSSFQTSCILDNKMIVLSDGDMVLNGVSQGQPLPMGVNQYTVGTRYQYQFSNREFVENCLEFLLNNSGLSEAKSKDYTLRLLDVKKVNDQKTYWLLFNLAFPVFLVFIFGIIYQWWRKRKYNKLV